MARLTPPSRKHCSKQMRRGDGISYFLLSMQQRNNNDRFSHGAERQTGIGEKVGNRINICVGYIIIAVETAGLKTINIAAVNTSKAS